MARVIAQFSHNELMYAGPFGARALMRSKGLTMKPTATLTMPRFDELTLPWEVHCEVDGSFTIYQGEDDI